MKRMLPDLIGRRWWGGLRGGRSLGRMLAETRDISARKSRQIGRALRVADAVIAQAARKDRRVLPHLFRLSWPTAAKLEAAFLFPVFCIIFGTDVTRAVAGVIAQATGTPVDGGGIRALAIATGLPNGLVGDLLLLPVPLIYLGCMVLVDRLLALPKGLAIAAIAMAPAWAFVAARLTAISQFTLPRHLFSAWFPMMTSAEIMALLTLLAVLLGHSQAIWTGLRDRGFYGRTLRYRRLAGRMP